ncbi:MAG: hypothetical protein KQJ78_25945 [Deltaproteobacteria bacterium]|nr:hypothetical protein [Deltaproteobacteria bacterium]
MAIDEYNFLKLLDHMLKQRINKYSHLKDNEDWKSHWDKVYQEIVTQYYQELKGEHAGFFSVLETHAININFKRREADFFEEERLRRALIANQAHDYIIETIEHEDDGLAIRYREYNYARLNSAGYFLEKSHSQFNKLPEEQLLENEVLEIAIDLVDAFKKNAGIGDDYAYIAEHLIFNTDKNHGQNGIIGELAAVLNETPDKIRTKKCKMIKKAKKIISNSVLDLEMAKKSMKIKRMHADKMEKRTNDQVAGEYIPTASSAKVIRTNICSINQLMDHEVLEFQELYCWHIKRGRKAGLDKQVGKAINDRPKSSPNRVLRTSTKKPSRSKGVGIPSKPSTDDAA